MIGDKSSQSYLTRLQNSLDNCSTIHLKVFLELRKDGPNPGSSLTIRLILGAADPIQVLLLSRWNQDPSLGSGHQGHEGVGAFRIRLNAGL